MAMGMGFEHRQGFTANLPTLICVPLNNRDILLFVDMHKTNTAILEIVTQLQH